MPCNKTRGISPLIATAAAVHVIALWCSAAWAQPPHAVDPLPNPLFSIDRGSPTIGPSLRPSDVLDKPGPSPVIPGAALGLVNPLDEIDGLSRPRDGFDPSSTFAVLFSVDRASVGAVPPDPALVAINRPFNVQDQALRGQAAADLFMSTLMFNMAGPISPGPFRGPGGNNTSVINQGDTGGVDYDLKPNKSSMTDTTGELQDDVDAVADKEGGGGPMRGGEGGGTGGGPGTGQPGGLFFSATRNSPSLSQLPGTPSGANIYFDPEPEIPGTTVLYAPAQLLGLQPGPLGDDIDGLVVIDNGDRVFTPGQDFILFTLSRESPSLGAAFRPSDILASVGGGAFIRFAQAADLGLLPTDHIDALEILITDDVDDAIFRHALLRVLPGDSDGDGVYTPVDCAGFEPCFSGPNMPFDPSAASFTVSVGPGQSFNPPDLSVETGDVVQWIWADGPHNVVSGPGVFDGAFTSGVPTSTAGATFTVAFDEALLNLHPRSGAHYAYFSEPDLIAGMVGTITVVAHPCATYDIDFDSNVDCNDWRLFKQAYAESGLQVCVLLTVPEFVAALLGQPIAPVHLCFADMNSDGLVNGKDVRPYVDAYLMSP